MSRASATVTFADGHQLFTLYNGTVDQLWTRLVDSLDVAWDELWGAYKGADFAATDAECTCGQDEPVTVSTDYGGGDSWMSWACRHCKAVTGRLVPDGYDDPY